MAENKRYYWLKLKEDFLVMMPLNGWKNRERNIVCST